MIKTRVRVDFSLLCERDRIAPRSSDLLWPDGSTKLGLDGLFKLFKLKKLKGAEVIKLSEGSSELTWLARISTSVE